MSAKSVNIDDELCKKNRVLRPDRYHQKVKAPTRPGAMENAFYKYLHVNCPDKYSSMAYKIVIIANIH